MSEKNSNSNLFINNLESSLVNDSVYYKKFGKRVCGNYTDVGS